MYQIIQSVVCMDGKERQQWKCKVRITRLRGIVFVCKCKSLILGSPYIQSLGEVCRRSSAGRSILEYEISINQ